MALLNAENFHPDIDTNGGIFDVDQVQLIGMSSAPSDSDLANGRLYYNTSTNKLMGRINGAWVDLGQSAGGATAYDDIGDPDANCTVAFAGYTNTWTSTLDTGTVFTISNTDASLSGATYLVELKFTDDGSANGYFLRCLDNSGNDAKFTVAADGATTIAGNSSGTDALTLSAGDLTLTSGHLVLTSGNLTLSSGNVDITGTLDASGNFNVNTNKFQVVAASGNTTVAGTLGVTGVASFTAQVNITNDNVKLALGTDDETDSYLYFDGANLVFYDSTLGTEKTLTQLASGFPSSPTISGDVTITDGKLDWTDAADEQAGTWTFANTTSNDIAISSAVTSGKSISITANALDSGSVLYIESSVAGMGATGNFIECYDGSGSVFEVGKYGAVIIAGNASGTDALTLTAGDVTLTSGHLNLTSGNIAMTDGNVALSEGKIEVDTTTDETSYVKRNKTGATNAVVEIEATHTGDTGSALLIDHNGTGNAIALEITHDGDYAAIDISAGAARTGNVINIAMANQLAETAIDITGAATGTAGEGIVHIDITGALAGNAIRIDQATGASLATGQLLYVLSAGDQAAATNGICAYFEDTGAAQATSYTVYISSTNNEALYVDSGDVKIDDNLTVGGTVGITGVTTASGAIDVTIADTGNDVAFTVNQNDTTNNPDAASIANTGTGDALFLNQDGNGITVSIDSEATSVDIFDVDADQLATGIVFDVTADALTSGGILNLVSDSADATARTLVQITNDNASAVGAKCLSIQNDADTVTAVFIDNNGDGNALEIDHDGSSASTIWAMKIDSDNAGAGVGGGIDFSSMGQDEPVLKAVADAISTAGTVSQQIAVDIGGTIYYLVAYTHGS